MSSDFVNQLGMSGGDLEERLAMLREQMAMNQLQMGLSPQVETMYRPWQPGMLHGLANLGAQVGGKALAGYLGGFF